MKKLEELEKKYAELGREIEALKGETKYPIYCLGKYDGAVVKFTSFIKGVVVKQGKRDVGHKSDFFVEHTSKTIWQQLDVCPNTGFYDGQLVWCWDNDDTHTRFLRFYDAKNKSTYYHYGERKGYGFYNYEPYEGNWPEWALEAFKTLER